MEERIARLESNMRRLRIQCAGLWVFLIIGLAFVCYSWYAVSEFNEMANFDRNILLDIVAKQRAEDGPAGGGLPPGK